jgi:3-isopropylmalate/(R)-2-methylmalate dehydratase large subunit
MPAMTFAEKALAHAAGISHARAGDILVVRPDRILSHDNTAAIAAIFYDELQAEKVFDPERLCVVLDHASPPPTPKHAQNHAEARQFVTRQGIRHFFDVGRGICHQVLSEEGLVLPGDLVLGADSHTTHFGWLGAFGAGIGRSEVAALWETGEIWLRVPKSLRINLIGEVHPDVTVKDLCLQISKVLGADGGLYSSLEFGGPGLANLSLDSRMVIPNSMAEIGVKNSYLPPDQSVFDYLTARSGVPEIEIRSRAIFPDEGAEYKAEYNLQLDLLEPMIACPHSVDNVKPLSSFIGQHIDMAFIGTCTNGRLEDLAAAAKVLDGHKVHTGTRLIVIPASNQIYLEALHKGYIDIILKAGASIGVPGCGPCMGNHLGVPAAGDVVISSANRNFKGRMGQPDASIYLASPEIVAASAVAGCINGVDQLQTKPVPVGPVMVRVDRKDSGIIVNRIESAGTPSSPEINRVSLDDLVQEKQVVLQQRKENLFRSGNKFTHNTLDGQGRVWKYGNNINTDQIFPGKYTYTVNRPEEIAAHAMEDLDAAFVGNVHSGDVIFGGSNFGCGSSREQAVTSLKYNGIRAVVAVSFARIFYRNAINQGMPAIVCPDAVNAAKARDLVVVDLVNGLIRLPAGSFNFPPFPPTVRAILKAGSLIEFTKNVGRK